eukprot:scaffold139520_cov18-Tisochrysis_lutea.AAC.1
MLQKNNAAALAPQALPRLLCPAQAGCGPALSLGTIGAHSEVCAMMLMAQMHASSVPPAVSRTGGLQVILSCT